MLTDRGAVPLLPLIVNDVNTRSEDHDMESGDNDLLTPLFTLEHLKNQAEIDNSNRKNSNWKGNPKKKKG
jgi:hypothetical protein